MGVLDLPEILANARDIATEVSAPVAAEVDRDARWPEESLRALQQAGIAGLNVPQTSGGLSQGMLALVQVCEILGRECPSSSICFGMHSVAAAVINAKSTESQRERYLEPIASGEHFTALALSEPGTGVHFYFPQAELVPEGEDAFRLSGAKSFVTNGGRADSYVVSTVAAEGGASPEEFSCVMVPSDASGVSWGPPWRGLGMRGNSSVEMRLDDVRLGREDLLGEPGDQIWYVFNVITPYFLAAMTGTFLGIAASALDTVLGRLGERGYAHGGRPPAQSPVVQHRLGTIWASAERTRRLAYHAALTGDRGGPHALELLFSAKAEIADCVVDVVNEAMTLCGGHAYQDGARLSRCLRNMRAVHVMAPTTDVLRTWTGRALLGLPILGD